MSNRLKGLRDDVDYFLYGDYDVKKKFKEDREKIEKEKIKFFGGKKSILDIL